MSSDSAVSFKDPNLIPKSWSWVMESHLWKTRQESSPHVGFLSSVKLTSHSAAMTLNNLFGRAIKGDDGLIKALTIVS